jgi:predicted hotdog family 3-hydroxylacyl-ACP dehydratase
VSRPLYTPANTLPHGPSMVLLDEVLAHDHEQVRCALTIRADSPFLVAAEQGVPGWVGVEYMAQSVGVWAGIQRLQAGLPVCIGLLLGTRRYDCSRAHFAIGTRLIVEATLLVRDGDGVGVFACTLGDGEQVWARADIKAFQPDDVDAYLQTLMGETA